MPSVSSDDSSMFGEISNFSLAVSSRSIISSSAQAETTSLPLLSMEAETILPYPPFLELFFLDPG